MDSGMDVIVFEGSTAKVAQWMRTVLRGDDGTLFLPAAAFGNENAVFMCAAYDGIKAVVYHKHPYLPVEWLCREYPDAVKAVDKMRGRLKETYG